MKNSFKKLRVSELEKVRDDLVVELRELRFREVVGELNNPVKKRNLRRSIARAKTLLHEYKTGIRKQQEG
jgi:large subunit ribosomal protein L29